MLSKNLERVIKREIHAQTHVFHVHACPGLVEETRKELEIIQNSSILPQKFQMEWLHERGHILSATMPLRNAIEVLYRVRTGSGMFWELATRRVSGIAELKRFLSGIRWELYIPDGASVSLSVHSYASRLYHEGMIKDLAREVLQEKKFTVVDGGSFHFYLESRENRVSLQLGLHGDPLQHRGFRSGLVHTAPMSEHIAAAATQWACTEFNAQAGHAYVPFCGSGTLAFEYVNAFYNIPNCLWGRSYAAEKLTCFPTDTGLFLKRKLQENVSAETDRSPLSVQCLDWQQEALQVAEKGWEHMMRSLSALPLSATFIEGDFFSFQPKQKTQLFIPLNPPFGERLALADVPAFYHRIGCRLVELQQESPLAGYIFIPSEAAWHSFLKAIKTLQFKTRRLMHGGLDLRLVAFAGKNN